MGARRIAAGVVGTAMTGATLLAGPVQAADQGATAACSLTLGTVTAQGDHKFQRITATTPVTVGAPHVGPKAFFPPEQVRLATSVGWEPDPPSGMAQGGYVRILNDLYRFRYVTDVTTGQLDPESLQKTRVGGGWGSQTYVEQSTSHTYALAGDIITRWTLDGSEWRAKATYGGFSAVKAMTLLSQTSSYDTFLANTRGGALYTIRIPFSGAPVVKKVRASTWQTFETLVAEKCGRQSTLLLAIDKDTRNGYLYAVSHANGTATVIKSLGKVGNQLVAPEDRAYFRNYPASSEANALLYGE